MFCLFVSGGYDGGDDDGGGGGSGGGGSGGGGGGGGFFWPGKFLDSLIHALDKSETLNNPFKSTPQARILDCGSVQTYDV